VNAVRELQDQAARLLADARANPRLGAMLLLVPLLLVCWLALVTRDAIEAAHDERAPLERRAARLAALAGGGEWEREIATGEAELGLWESQAWRASSADLAAADLQTALRGIIVKHLAWNRLKLAQAEELRTLGGWRINAEINGKLRESGVMPLLQELAEHTPRIRLEQLQVSSQRGQTVSLQLSVLVLREPAP
jgi:hypothetical protein